MSSYEEDKKIREMERISNQNRMNKIIIGTGLLILFLLALLLAFGPIYTVWSQRLAGEAELAKAESNRQIRILEARAEQEASKALERF